MIIYLILLKRNINKYNLWKYDYFIDVGANIGTCSMLMLQANIKVIAFEPIRNNLFLFSKTILYNKKYINNFTLYMIGLGKESKITTIYLNYKNWGASSIFRKTSYPEKIIIYKLDDISIKITNKIGMMKIDIECNELNMIRGAKNFIKNSFIKLIHFEQLCDCYRDNKQNPYEIYSVLISIGYKIINKLNCSKEKGKDVIAIRT